MYTYSDVLKKSAPITREKCEAVIESLFREIVDIYHLYNPDGNYLTIAYINDDNDQFVTCNNRYHAADEETGEPAGEDFDHPIHFDHEGPLTIQEQPAHSSAFKEMIVTGFTGEQFEEIKKLNSECGKRDAEELALEIINKRNHNRGSCWANGYGIYGFNLIDNGVTFLIGSSCD